MIEGVFTNEVSRHARRQIPRWTLNVASNHMRIALGVRLVIVCGFAYCLGITAPGGRCASGLGIANATRETNGEQVAATKL